MIKVLALQRRSHVAAEVMSLSVEARITEVLDYLADHSHLTYAAVPEDHDRVLSALDWADVLVLSKHSSQAAIEISLQAKQRGLQIVYDIDDWVFSFPNYSNGQGLSKKLDAITKLISLSDVVSVANKRLLQAIHPYCDKPVLIPNGMYVEKYIKDMDDLFFEANPPRIVFTNADFIKVNNSKEIFLRVLQDFFHRHPEYTLDFYGDPFPEIFSLPFLHFTNRMSYADYMLSLKAGKYRFAITPLGGHEDNDSLFFNSCKNPFKYLNYGAAGVPGVYSNSPIYSDCISSGKEGFLVENTYEDWLLAMERLDGDMELRQKIREAAFADVLSHHHIRYSAEAFMKAIN